MLHSAKFTNPFKPGAGHSPPYLAGRRGETREFERLLEQKTILDNLVLTGLRGAGKTVLLDTFKPTAQSAGWFWVGNDVSEAATRDEAALALRILTDLSTVTSSIEIPVSAGAGIGFGSGERTTRRRLDFNTLSAVYERVPGLVGDKLKGVLSAVWEVLQSLNEKPHGIVFAYDEAQNLADHAAKEQHPLSLLLDTFASLQKQGAPFLLVLTGLPTLFPSLVEARTFSERMFRVMFLQRLDRPFSASHANQMLAALAKSGLVYKNRHGRYSFAVPMLGPFVLRQMG